VEVKSVTLVEGGTARFPDAPTARGARHVRELAQLASTGERAMILFVVQREDARRVTPHRGIDPTFAHALEAARRAGVLLRAARFRLDAWGRSSYRGPLPVRV
jgi:sugar fermentation stimulation protein A